MEVENLPLQITPLALLKIKDIMLDKKIMNTDYGLRIGMKGGACSASFLLGFDKKNERDKDYHLDDLNIFIDKKHLMYIIGLEIDFEEHETTSGFVFNNPNKTLN